MSEDDTGVTRWLDEREQLAWRSFITLQHGLNRVLERQLQRDAGLSMADYTVLVTLSEAPERRCRHFELSQRIHWEKSRLSHHLTRMTQRGLVERASCPEDSRGGFVVLTETGASVIAAAAPRHVEHVRRWFIDQLDRDQLEALISIGQAVSPALDEA